MREEAAEDRKREIKRKLNGHTGIRGADESGAGESDSEDNSTDDVPQHESLSTTVASSEENKTARTVFLGNVSTQAIKSKSAKKILLTHLSKFLKHLPDRDVPHKIESLRFRSTAFNVTVGPKKAAFAKKELMDSTTKSTNAYVVYSTEGAARRAVSTLNGTIVLDRHLRVDSIANPSTIDQRRCIFVGNLGFVDKEILDDNNDEDDKASRRNKAKEPADAEEGLWRTFSKVGTVESVRVVRDKSTRIGKGIAYVQFKDENAVEAALLYNDKKFPPLLPRKLRVSRTRKIRKHYPQSTSTAGASRSRDKFKQGGQMQSFKRSKRPDAAGRGSTSGARKPGPFVFEGYRASSADGKPRLKGRGKSDGKARKGKPTTRSSRRGAAFKAGGKKNS
jgi:nucleolar protein 12